MAIIYKITNTINNKVYIGQTVKSLQSRWQQHLTDARNHKYKNSHFSNALQQYDPSVFKTQILEYCTEQELNQKEKYWINFYDSYNNGYNSTLGGDGGLKYNVDTTQVLKLIDQGWTLEKISEKINIPQKIISRQLKNANLYDQKKIRKNVHNIPVYQWDNVGNLINIFKSAMEVQQKLGFDRKAISQAIRNNTRSSNFYWTHGEKPEYKYRIAQYDKFKNFIRYWKDAAQAAKTLNFDASGISKCCRGECDYYKGYIWKRQ